MKTLVNEKCKTSMHKNDYTMNINLISIKLILIYVWNTFMVKYLCALIMNIFNNLYMCFNY